MRRIVRGTLLAAFALLPACASLGSLGQILQPLSFQVDHGQQAQLRLVGPSLGNPLGGAGIRLFARVRNPNPLGLTLSRIQGGLSLEGHQAANVNFPLGLPLSAGQETVIPLDITVSFSQLGGLADVASKALRGSPIQYRLDGNFAVDAGPLGQPSFGPMTLLEGNLAVTR
ncbi:MAG TPA: LEA type 2 family protein [Longimicrobiaceae bacterium]|jgi:hypothetical protein|nr:LEA type 2 family protein [Longimicrobiaceae bacterium]